MNRRKKSKSKATSVVGLDFGTDTTDEVDGVPFSLLPTSSDYSVTEVLALDCEMVGVGPRKTNALGRVSIVNMWGNVVYDKHVQPDEVVTDYRTRWSGIRPSDLSTVIGDCSTAQAGQFKEISFRFKLGKPAWEVLEEVSKLLNNRILVGHALHHDLQVLLLQHPQRDIRDTQTYGPFRSEAGRFPGLKHLAHLHLGAKIQQGEHDSVEDARTALSLYLMFEDAWEKSLDQSWKKKRTKSAVGGPFKKKIRI